LLKSAATEQELLAVLRRSRFAGKIAPFFVDGRRRMLAAAELVSITEQLALCRDPGNDKFLELAINGEADLIVSGDDDLLAMGSVRDIPIVAPAAFCASGIAIKRNVRFLDLRPPRPVTLSPGAGRGACRA
jgi:uncharacterized protein